MDVFTDRGLDARKAYPRGCTPLQVTCNRDRKQMIGLCKIERRQGGARDLDMWLSEGAVDVIMTFESVTRGAQTVHALPPETLLLCSDRPDTPMDADPLYTFVDHGEDYRRQHAEDYHDAGVARISFDSSWWALQCILDRGGSAYLPETMVRPYLEDGRLYPVAHAPIYQRKKNLIANDASVQNWAWFQTLIDDLRGGA